MARSPGIRPRHPPPGAAQAKGKSQEGLSPIGRATEDQVGYLMSFFYFPLRFSAFIWYKQCTESRVWLAGRFCRNSRRWSGI